MRASLSLCLFLMLICAGCTQNAVATPSPVLIRIAGSNSMRPVLQALTDEFSQRHPNVVFDLRGGGSTLGQEDVAASKIDLAASILSLPTGGTPTDPKLRTLVRTPIGIDGLAIITHSTNKIDSLTLVQLRDLFHGKILNWQEVGGADSDILLVSREDGSGARLLFEERVMGPEPVSLTAIVMPTSADVVDFVSKSPLAIGYVSRSYVTRALTSDEPGAQVERSNEQPATQDERLAESGVRVIALEGELPQLDKLAAQQYALVYPIFLVSRGAPTGWNARFLDFVLSLGGQRIVRRFSAPVR